jgi:hypothetical protein
VAQRGGFTTELGHLPSGDGDVVSVESMAGVVLRRFPGKHDVVEKFVGRQLLAPCPVPNRLCRR